MPTPTYNCPNKSTLVRTSTQDNALESVLIAQNQKNKKKKKKRERSISKKCARTKTTKKNPASTARVKIEEQFFKL